MSSARSARSSITGELEKLTKGLSYQSESDYPVKPVFIEGGGKKSLKASDLPGAEKPVKQVDLDEFFATATTEKDWHGPEERATVKRFQELVSALKENLSDIKVFKTGKVKMDVYVLGRTKDGDFAGVTTTVVET